MTGQTLARKTSETHPTIWGSTICLVKKEKQSDLKIFRQIGKRMKKLQWIMMMIMNCFWGMADRQKAFSLISSRDHCQRSLPSHISDTPWPGFEPAQNLSSDFAEWCCPVVITTTPRRQKCSWMFLDFEWAVEWAEWPVEFLDYFYI